MRFAAGVSDEIPPRALLLGLLGLALAVRTPLILAYPAVYGDDAVLRLARSDELLLAYQLPLPQLLVRLARAFSPDPLAARLLFALFGSAVSVSLARALCLVAGRPAALAAGVLAASHPLLLYYSLVPYQESLTLWLLLEAAVALQRRRETRAATWLALACLCRYEAWIAAALTAAARRRSPGRALLSLSAPLVWIVWWRGLAPPGTYVLDLDPAGWSGLAFLGSKLSEYTGRGTLALAACGALLVAWRRSPALLFGASFLAAFLAAVAASAHEFPVGSGRVSERLAHVPALASCTLAGLALAWFAALPSGQALRRAAAGAAGLGIAFQACCWLGFSQALVATANHDPSLVLACDVARLAGQQLRPGERLAVLGPAVPRQAVLDYVRKVAASGGDATRARQVAEALASHSPDADRIAGNLARPAGTVIEDAAAGTLLAVFDDAEAPGLVIRRAWVARFVAGARAVSIYRTPTS